MGIPETGTRRTVDLAAATQPIIGLPTLTLMKGVAVSSEAIHTNLLTIETGNRVVHNGPMTAETTIGHGLLFQIDLARLPLNIVYPHVRTSPHMTYGGRPGIGEGIIILATKFVTDTTVQTTRSRFVTTVPKEIHGGPHMITDHGLLHPLLLELLRWITLRPPLALPTMRRTASIPPHHHPQTLHLLHLQNDPCPQNINQYFSPFLQRSLSLPNLVGLHRRLMLRLPPKPYQRRNRMFSINLFHHRRHVQNVRDVLVKRRDWLTAIPSPAVGRFTTTKLLPNWGRARLVRFTKRYRRPQERLLLLRGSSCTTRRKECPSLLFEKLRSSKL